MAKKKKQAKQTAVVDRRSSKILYVIAAVVILVPLLLLGYIYLTTKENKGTPTVGSRFDDELTTKIADSDLEKVRSSLQQSFTDAESIEVNLTSATVRITIDLKDDSNNDKVTAVLDEAYEVVDDILPVETYFTNQDETKMYDLDIHVYNFIPEEDGSTDGWVYKEKTKNAASKKPVVNTQSQPKNEDVSKELLEEQEKLKKQE